MPQMAPLLWTALLTMFSLALALFVVKIYFLASTPCTANSPVMPSQQKPSWQW